MTAVTTIQPAAGVQPTSDKVRLPVDLIDVPDRLRRIDPHRCAVLRHSILSLRTADDSGQLQPIEVRPVNGRYELTIGAHRLETAKGLGDTHIDAIIKFRTPLQARLAEIDENLMRHELSAFDRAVFLAERKSIYEEMHPETKKGKAGALKRWTDANDKMSSAEDAAEPANLTPRQIQRDIKMLTALSDDTRSRIPGTWLADHQAQLKALAKCGPEQQAKVLDALLRADKPAANVAAALAEVDGRRASEATDDDKDFAKMIAGWTRASRRVRAMFLGHLYETGDLQKFMDGAETEEG